MVNPTECEVKHIDCGPVTHDVPEPSALPVFVAALVLTFALVVLVGLVWHFFIKGSCL